MRWLLKRGWMYAAMVAISAFALFPIYWVVITSLKPRSEIYTRTPDLWPSDPQWDQYPRVLGEGHVGRALMNSLIVASGTMVICLLVERDGRLRAGALPRAGHTVLLMLVLMTQMFPLVVLVIPLFVTMRKAGLLGTYWSLIITYLAFSVPLAIWVMRGFILSIPEELEHAARIDGATRFGAMVQGRAAAGRARPGGDRGARLPGGLEGVPARADVHQRGGAQDRAAGAADLRRARRHRLGRGDGHQRALHAAGRARVRAGAQAPDDRADRRGGEGCEAGRRGRAGRRRAAARRRVVVDGASSTPSGSGGGGQRHRRARVHRPAGQRVRGRGPDGHRPRRLRARRRGAAGHRHDRLPADVRDRAGGGAAGRAAGDAAGGIGPRVLGAHVEGPFLSPRRAGVHDPRWLSRPTSRCCGACWTPRRCPRSRSRPSCRARSS